MRTFEKPLPGDVVIRSRHEQAGRLRQHVYVLCHWPETEVVIGGPYQSYGYALRQGRTMLGVSVRLWRDHASPGMPEQLEDVTN